VLLDTNSRLLYQFLPSAAPRLLLVPTYYQVLPVLPAQALRSPPSQDCLARGRRRKTSGCVTVPAVAPPGPYSQLGPSPGPAEYRRSHRYGGEY
jgi:hypothetical protein